MVAFIISLMSSYDDMVRLSLSSRVFLQERDTEYIVRRASRSLSIRVKSNNMLCLSSDVNARVKWRYASADGIYFKIDHNCKKYRLYIMGERIARDDYYNNKNDVLLRIREKYIGNVIIRDRYRRDNHTRTKYHREQRYYSGNELFGAEVTIHNTTNGVVRIVQYNDGFWRHGIRKKYVNGKLVKRSFYKQDYIHGKEVKYKSDGKHKTLYMCGQSYYRWIDPENQRLVVN